MCTRQQPKSILWACYLSQIRCLQVAKVCRAAAADIKIVKFLPKTLPAMGIAAALDIPADISACCRLQGRGSVYQDASPGTLGQTNNCCLFSCLTLTFSCSSNPKRSCSDEQLCSSIISTLAGSRRHQDIVPYGCCSAVVLRLLVQQGR